MRYDYIVSFHVQTSDRALLGRESQEFAKAAVIFKPMSSAFASRFTSSTSQPANIVETALASGGGLQTIEEMQAKKLLAETVAPKPVQKQPEDDVSSFQISMTADGIQFPLLAETRSGSS